MNQRFLAAAILLAPAALAQTDMGRILPADRPVHFFAFGDYGSGSPHQADVAEAIGVRHAEVPFDFGITVGDNFYRCGVHSTKDELWKLRFENLYASLGLKIYASLGNHDYGHPVAVCPTHRGSPDAEVAYTASSDAWRMPARYYTFTAGPARFFAIDTEGWSEKELQWLVKALADSQNEPGVKWRIVYGHHPMRSSGAHSNESHLKALDALLAPVFHQNHVDLYIAGHDHDMEHLRKDGVDYIVCGTGGAELRKTGRTLPESIFHAVTYGFADLRLDTGRLTFSFYDTGLHSLEDPEPIIRKP